jgi:hypothetical protein
MTRLGVTASERRSAVQIPRRVENYPDGKGTIATVKGIKQMLLTHCLDACRCEEKCNDDNQSYVQPDRDRSAVHRETLLTNPQAQRRGVVRPSDGKYTSED